MALLEALLGGGLAIGGGLLSASGLKSQQSATAKAQRRAARSAQNLQQQVFNFMEPQFGFQNIGFPGASTSFRGDPSLGLVPGLEGIGGQFGGLLGQVVGERLSEEPIIGPKTEAERLKMQREINTSLTNPRTLAIFEDQGTSVANIKSLLDPNNAEAFAARGYSDVDRRNLETLVGQLETAGLETGSVTDPSQIRTEPINRLDVANEALRRGLLGLQAQDLNKLSGGLDAFFGPDFALSESLAGRAEQESREDLLTRLTNRGILEGTSGANVMTGFERGVGENRLQRILAALGTARQEQAQAFNRFQGGLQGAGAFQNLAINPFQQGLNLATATRAAPPTGAGQQGIAALGSAVGGSGINSQMLGGTLLGFGQSLMGQNFGFNPFASQTSQTNPLFGASGTNPHTGQLLRSSRTGLLGGGV